MAYRQEFTSSIAEGEFFIEIDLNVNSFVRDLSVVWNKANRNEISSDSY